MSKPSSTKNDPSKKELDTYLDVEEQDSRRVQKGTLKRMIRRIVAHRGLVAAGLALILVSTAATLAGPRLFGYAVDDAIVPGRRELLVWFAVGFLVLELTRYLATVGHSYLFTLLGQKVMQDLRLDLFSHLQRLPVSVYDKNPVGRLVTRVTNDITALAEMFSAGFVTIIGNALVVAGIFAWMLVLDLRLGLIAASVLPLLVGGSIYFSRRLRVAYRDARSKLSALNAFLAENILGMRVVHLFNRQARHMERFGRINQWYSDAQIGSVRVFALFQPMITLLAGLAMSLVIWFGGLASREGSLKVGVLIAFFSYVLSLFQPIREIADKWNIFLSGMASAERSFSVLDWSTELSEDESEPVARPIEGLRGHVVFENVWFAYSGENWVLRDFSLEIKPGMKVGVVGHTGAGKTTLISLLMRFYDPQVGRILLDGKDIRSYDKRSLRASIGIIQQDVFLFSGTVDDNVTLWREGEAQWPQELKLERGLAIQERGSNLSMGQRQAVAFSRAMHARPPIWILDEATANIDTETEAMLERMLRESSHGRTMVMIAHRMATVRSADLILVLHKGSMVEVGNHSQLMARNGLYARLYRYQSVAKEDALLGVNEGDPLTQAP